MAKENLNNDGRHPVIRIGNEVHRPVGWWTRSVHELLNYLESIDFKYSPKVLGFDDEGREILSYIEGESGKDGWSKVVDESGLRKFAKLLREYHTAVAGFKPSQDSEWAYANGQPKKGEIMCHGDFGPWNVVWQDEEPVGLVDWDFVLPAKPEYDILYALEYSVPFRDDNYTLEWHHFPEIPNRKQRVQTFLEAYGAGQIDKVASKVAHLQRTVGKYEAILAEKGVQPQANWVAHGDLERIENLARWTELHPELFE